MRKGSQGRLQTLACAINGQRCSGFAETEKTAWGHVRKGETGSSVGEMLNLGNCYTHECKRGVGSGRTSLEFGGKLWLEKNAGVTRNGKYYRRRPHEVTAGASRVPGA